MNKFKYKTDEKYLEYRIPTDLEQKLESIKYMVKEYRVNNRQIEINTADFIISNLLECIYIKEATIQDMERYLKDCGLYDDTEDSIR